MAATHPATMAAVRNAGCPADMVRVATFCMDTYEAHLMTKGDDSTVVQHPYHRRPADGIAYLAVSEPGAWPQAYINRPEAESACEQAGKRLCTVAEWYRACAGPDKWPFPYGVREQRGACNTKKPHILSRFFGTDPYRWKYSEHFNAPRLNQEPGYLAKTGEYAKCVTREGIHDLVGNLHEWVSDTADSSLAGKLPLTPGIYNSLGGARGHGVFMGGFYSTGSQHGRGCAFVTLAHEPTYHDYSTGFRCCRD